MLYCCLASLAEFAFFWKSWFSKNSQYLLHKSQMEKISIYCLFQTIIKSFIVGQKKSVFEIHISMRKIASILKFSNKKGLIFVWQKISKLLTRLETSTLTWKSASKSKSIHQNILWCSDNILLKIFIITYQNRQQLIIV